MSVAVPVLLLTLACAVPGVPLALLVLRRARPNSAVVWAVGIGLGLFFWQLVGIPLVHHGRFDVPTMLVVGAVATGLAWIPARRHVELLRPARPGWLAALLAALAVPAVALRDSPVYFIYQVADFGEYVNRSNIVADGGRFGGYFVNGFTLLLAESHLLLGESRHVDAMPFLGLLAGVLVVVAARVAGAPSAVQAAVAVVWTVHVQSVWFGQFPASEVPYAVFLALAIGLTTMSIRADDAVPGVVAGALGFSLVVTRGNGLVYLPVVVAGIAAAPLLVSSAKVWLVRAHFLALASGLWLGTLYDGRFNAPYFLRDQASARIPGRVGELFARLDEAPIALGFTAAVAVILLAAVASGLLVERLRAAPAWFGLGRRATVTGLFLAAVVAHAIVIPVDQWRARYEVLGVAIAVPLALVVVVWTADRIDDDAARFAIGWSAITGIAFTTFQASRLVKSVTVDGPWFLYWDRYFFSETFPMLLLSGAVAAGVVWPRMRTDDPAAGRSRNARLGLVAIVVYALAVVADSAAPVANAVDQEMFEDTYEEVAIIDRFLAEPLPAVFDGAPSVPHEWIWSNTTRTLVHPLEQTFPNRFLNRGSVLAPDPRPSSFEIRQLLADAGADEGYVLQTHHDGTFPPHDGRWLEAEVVGELLMEVERLKGSTFVRPEDQRWVTSTLHVRVLRVRLTPNGTESANPAAEDAASTGGS